MGKLIPRRIFLDGPKLPSAVFYTSSHAKYLQARLVFEGTGLSLAHRRNTEDPYREDYNGTKEELLESAIREIHRRGGSKGSFIFIEDTSIRIEALSDKEDYPGLAAKEWFQRTSFEELDQQLSDSGDRRAIVRSCIALSVPGLSRTLFFYGDTRGVVADAPAQFEADAGQPWLSASNFSAWFIPDGSNQTLSEMSFEASLDHDFRVRSLLALLDRLEEYALCLNASGPMYSVPPPYAKIRTHGQVQQELFQVEIPSSLIWLVIGPTCAGKTTFGNYAQQHVKCHVVDASAIVRSIRHELKQDEAPIGEFAAFLLREMGPDSVAIRIAQSYRSLARGTSLIITGFRAIEEIQYFRDKYSNVRVLSIEASSRLRYQRYVRRGTRDAMSSFEEFRKYDSKQFEFGLLPVADELADVRIVNEFTLDSYYRQVTKVLGVTSEDVKGIINVSSHMSPVKSQLYRCLAVLRGAGRPLTTQEIEDHLPDAFAVRYNNANKMLKRYPELARRQEGQGVNVRYHITSAGLAFLAAIDQLHDNG